MAKHRIGAERKQPRISYLTRSPSEPPELMSLDESETLLGFQYGVGSGCGGIAAANSKFMVSGPPSVAVVELGVPTLPVASLNKRMPSISSTITQSPAPSPYTEQSTITSAGKFWNIYFFRWCVQLCLYTIKKRHIIYINESYNCCKKLHL